jgi:hypothetical protein
MQSDLIDLAGLPFLAKSGNGGIIQLLGESGLHLKWERAPSEDDMRELEAWVQRKTGPLNIHRHIAGGKGIAESHRAYQKFLDERTR